MAGSEYRYDPRSQCFQPTGQAAEPRQQQPWRRLERRSTGALGDRQNDGELALELLAPGGLVADVGCGDAFMARHFARDGRFDAVLALDVSWDVLNAARVAAEEEGLAPEDGLFFLRCDATELPFLEGQLDSLWWGQGLHLVGDPGRALASMFAALAPGGGRLVATTMAVCFPGPELRALAVDAGFSDVKLVKSAGRTIYTLTAVKK